MSIRWLLVLLFLTGCWDKGTYKTQATEAPEPTPPPASEGTLLSSECRDFTKVEVIADGVGGQTEKESPESPECGWNPEPTGTLSDTECRDFTLVSTYHDGSYGFYEAAEEDSEECGYIEPTLNVLIDNASGDRFKPVIVFVDYREQGEPAEWDFEVPYGSVEVYSDRLEIFGDGQRHSDLALYINGEEFLYQLYPEPRCGKVDPYTDCQGYRYKGVSGGYIYYGEEDQQVVEWQLGYIYYDNTLEPYEFVQSDGDDAAWREASLMVGRMNKVYEDSGVYIRLILEPSAVGFGRYMNNSGHTDMARKIGTADVSLGRGITCPNSGGCAMVSTHFRANTGFTLAGTIRRADAYTGLHEIGHTAGLAHGPDNSAHARDGYIWPDFGHGYSEPFCNTRAIDIMSYGVRSFTHNNSTQTCDDGWPAGDRSSADSAYHLNRVRYDVSLIGVEQDAPPAFMDELPEVGPLVVD